MNTSELRQNYVHAHGVALHALGHVGIPLLQEPAFTRPYTEEAQGHRLGQSELRLEGRAMIHGRISKARTSVLLTSNFIKKSLGIELTDTGGAGEQLGV